MAYNTKIHLTDDKVCQSSGELLTLSGNTVIDATQGTFNYSQEPSWTGDTQVATKKYVDDNVTSGATYSEASPATTDVGGITAGTVLTGKTSNEILAEILTPYQTPTFSSFSSEMTTPVEVGTVLSGSKEFNWVFTNSDNIQANTMCIYDVTDASTIATNISTTSPQLNDDPVTIGGGGYHSISDFFLGDIDDVRIYNRVLSDSEVTELYLMPAPMTLSGWVFMIPDAPDFGYSLDEDDLVYFYSSEPVLTYNMATGLRVEGPLGWTYFYWPFLYELDTDILMFALPPESGLWVYHFSTGEWEVLPRIIPW